MNTYREVATKARSSSFSSSWAKIRLFDEEEENDGSVLEWAIISKVLSPPALHIKTIMNVMRLA